MMTVAALSDAMATWVGVFVSNIDGRTLRELEVEADTEEEAVILLDLYNYDETWQNYSFLEIRKKKWDWLTAMFAVLKKLLSKR
ncbi:MAG TPA: hypothetical protein V6D11_27225 [Waterburya sp.]|jgi:hypothetical protein